jgi:hypothetical protein
MADGFTRDRNPKKITVTSVVVLSLFFIKSLFVPLTLYPIVIVVVMDGAVRLFTPVGVNPAGISEV